jgi:hypothetical protein
VKKLIEEKRYKRTQTANLIIDDNEAGCDILVQRLQGVLCENPGEYGMMGMGGKPKNLSWNIHMVSSHATCERLLVRRDHFGIKRDTSPRGKPSEQNYGTALSPAFSVWKAGGSFSIRLTASLDPSSRQGTRDRGG